MKKLVIVGFAAMWILIAWSAAFSGRERPDARPPVIANSTDAENAPAQPLPYRPVSPPRAQPAMPSPALPTTIAAVASQLVGEDEVAEDEDVLAENSGPEQSSARAAWSTEIQDDQWTREMAKEIATRGESLVRGDLKLHDLSCRETVCRFYLQFADRTDAQSYMAGVTDAALQYQYQRLDPQFEGGERPQSALEYEVMVNRPRSGRLTTASTSLQGADEEPALPGEDQLITIVSKRQERDGLPY